MKLSSLLLSCVLAACSGKSAGELDQPAQPSPGLEPALPKDGAPVLAAAQPSAAALPDDAAKPAPAAATSCTFGPLDAFEGRTMKWEGECLDGKANGKGVLRAYPKAGSADKAVLIYSARWSAASRRSA